MKPAVRLAIGVVRFTQALREGGRPVLEDGARFHEFRRSMVAPGI